MIWEAFAGLMLVTFCGGMLAMWPFARKSCRDEAYEMGRSDAYEEIRATRPRTAGSHADGCACTSLVGSPPALPSEMTPPRPVPADADPNRWRTWSPGPSPRAVTAASIAPVVLPEPGTYLPGPRRSTAPGTVTFPKVQLDTATTGEIRAIGDEMVAAIEAAGEA